MYSISKVAKMIGVSRQSIYNKIDKEGLQQYLVDGEKGKALTEQGVEILKKLFSEYLENKPSSDNSQTIDGKTTVNCQDDLHLIDSITAEYINSLKDEIEHLKGVIVAQTQQTADITRLLENSQVLLKHEQERNKLLLESAESKTKSRFLDIFRKKRPI